MIELQHWATIDKLAMDVAKSGMSDPSELGSIVVAVEAVLPSAPTMSLASATTAVVLTLTKPTTKANGSALNNFREFGIYYSTTPGIDITDSGTYDGVFYNPSTSVPHDCTVKTYFVATAFDTFGNESAACAEDDETPAGSTPPSSSIPDDASGHIFDDAVSVDGIVVGDGIIGIVFKTPGTSWVNFNRYKLEYAVDSGGGFGAWTEIPNATRGGYVHKNLNTGYAYKYRAYIVADDGTISTTPDVEDNATAGFTPNAADNSDIVAVLVLAENIIALNEVRGESIKATTTITAGTGTDVGVLDGANATYRIYAGHSTPASAPFRVTKAGALTATGATITGAITASSGSIGGFTIGASALTAGAGGTAVGIAPATYPFYAGSATAASAPFRVSSAGALVATSATITGAITASSGTIGGFTIGASALTAGAGGSAVGLAPGTYPFYAGSATAASAPFRVSSAGALVATSATITGAITASSGSIGGFTIGASALTAGAGASAVGLAPGTYPFYAGSATAASAPFRVSAAGAVTCTSISCTNLSVGAGSTWAGNVLGTAYIPNLNASKITAGTMVADRISGGTIGACTINAAYITAGSFSADRISGGTLDCSTMTVSNLSAGSINTGTLNFASISRSGLAVIASELSITTVASFTTDLGAITAGTITSGAIRTAASGARAVLNSTVGWGGANHCLSIYDASAERVRVTDTGVLTKNASGGSICVLGSGGLTASAVLYQPSSTAAIPVLLLDQDDTSEGFIDFVGSGRGNVISSSTQSVTVELNGTKYVIALYPYQ